MEIPLYGHHDYLPLLIGCSSSPGVLSPPLRSGGELDVQPCKSVFLLTISLHLKAV